MVDKKGLGIAFFFFGIILIATMSIINHTLLEDGFYDTTERTVKCYDKYSNEIIGSKCLENHFDNKQIIMAEFTMLLILFGIIMFLLGIITLITQNGNKTSEVKG